MNVTALVDTSGTVLERVVYDPYGKATFYDGSWTSPSATSAYDNVVLYCGYRWDGETGLYHVRHRMYHASLGRWNQRDPAGYVDGVHSSLVIYCGAQPVTSVDPLGLFDLVGALKMYFVNDRGGPFARRLMEHRLLGGGKPFRRGTQWALQLQGSPQIVDVGSDGAEWSAFMKDRPEIHADAKSWLAEKASAIARSSQRKIERTRFEGEIQGTRLELLLSMTYTLYGAHEIRIEGYYTRCDEYVDFYDLTFTWIDAGDLDPDAETQLGDGSTVQDADLALGTDYDIAISWTVIGSNWEIVGGQAPIQTGGWPP